MLEQKIEILYIDRNPLQKMGEMAGICWNAQVDDPIANIRRALGCIRADHGRVLEFVEVTMAISGISCRLGRELYTHIGGAPTRLQRSTRYVDESGFDYYEPASCKDSPAYDDAMKSSAKLYAELLEAGVPREDAANVLPLGLDTKIVWKVNLRTLVNFFNKRLCTRALKEIREFAVLLKKTLENQSDEWDTISKKLFVPSCEVYKFMNPDLCFCREAKCCGRHPKIDELVIQGQANKRTEQPAVYHPRCIDRLDSFDLDTIRPAVDRVANTAGMVSFAFTGRDVTRCEEMREIFLSIAHWVTGDDSDLAIRDEDVMLQGQYGTELYITATCLNNWRSYRDKVASLCIMNDTTTGGVNWAFAGGPNHADPVTPELCVAKMREFLQSLPWNGEIVPERLRRLARA